MRHLFAILLLLTGPGLFANMASPVRPGTYSSSAFSSRDIDILDETIQIKPDRAFKTAAFHIEYHIQSDTAGKQVPLLFHALDYQGNFRVTVDGQEIFQRPVPELYLQPGPALTDRFPALHGMANNEGPRLIFWDNDHFTLSSPEDLKFFEADLSRGEHRIRVEYTAKVWTDRSDWVKAYSFRYSLSPARHWRSFGQLIVQLDTSAFTGAIRTNLGMPVSREGSRINWQFSKLPADYLMIGYTPPLNTPASILIGIGPLWLSVLFGSLFVMLHVFCIKKYRERNPSKSFSWVLILGIIAVPFIILAGYPCAYNIIDNAIGPDAGRFHGYNILVIGLYPFFLPFYGLIMWYIDRRIKRQQGAKTP